jgi:hypothetical protein
MPKDDPYRIWTTMVQPWVKDRGVFLCPSAPNARYAADWSTRDRQPIGYTSATAYWSEGCDDSDPDHSGCEGWDRVVRRVRLEHPSRVPLFADTPAGPVEEKYRGYSFNPYNGISNAINPHLGLPLVSDRDLVAELGADLAPDQLKPVYCRHNADGREHGRAVIILGDGHAKAYTAASILAMDQGANLEWRFR